MFWVGVSVTLPDACGLVVRVFVEDPAVAVIETDVALVLCQLTVTLCPGLMDAGLTDSVMVGGGVFETPVAHPLIPAKTADKVPRATQQKRVFLIRYVSL